MPIQNPRARKLLVTFAAAWVTACGDGGGVGDPGPAATLQPAASAPTAPLRVESRVQPVSAAEKTVSPIERRAALLAPDAARIALDALASEKSADGSTADGMRRIGAARAVERTATPSVTRTQLQWQPAAAGGKKAALSFTAERAVGLRLGIQVGKLPGSSILRVYRQSDPTTAFRISGQQVLQTIQRNLESGDASDSARTWWSPDLGGAEVTFEIELPADVPTEAVEISVPTLSHIFIDASLPERDADRPNAVGDANACNLDASCYANYGRAADSVARMMFVQNGVSYQCTGTLLNNRESDSTPYFLSAQHCIQDQTTASTLTTDWFFRSPSCGARTLGSARTSRYGGAQLLYASAATDTAFLLLNDAPPANASFAAWDASTPVVGSPVAGLHHARGDLLKISFGSVQDYSTCTAQNSNGAFSCSPSGSSAPFVRTRWNAGTTEAGSSGSPLFSSSGSSDYLIGTLRGGNTSCTIGSGLDVYGRFDIAFHAALRNWLDPASARSSPAGRLPIYRFYNTATGAHFYTAVAAERDQVIANLRTFRFEGIAFYAYGGPAAGQSPVHRFYNMQTGAHFYTISSAERDAVLALPQFRFEGTGWFAQPGSGSGAVPLFRFFESRLGTHFYTINASERNGVMTSYPNFAYEGIAYYGWTGSD